MVGGGWRVVGGGWRGRPGPGVDLAALQTAQQRPGPGQGDGTDGLGQGRPPPPGRTYGQAQHAQGVNPVDHRASGPYPGVRLDAGQQGLAELTAAEGADHHRRPPADRLVEVKAARHGAWAP